MMTTWTPGKDHWDAVARRARHHAADLRARLRAWRMKRARIPRGRKILHTVAASIIGVFVVVAAAGFMVPGNAYRGIAEEWMSAQTGRIVHIHGDLHMNILSSTPGIDVRGLTISNPAWAGGGQMATVGHLALKLALRPLFNGVVVLPLVMIEQPNVILVRDEDGRANWITADDRTANTDSSLGEDVTSSGNAMRLPAIQRFIVADGHLRIEDRRRKMEFDGTIASHEEPGGGAAAFVMTGAGHLNRLPFEAQFRGGSLIHVDEHKPYTFTATARAGTTTVSADGRIDHPFDFNAFNAEVTFEGHDMADLYYLTGLTLPNTPPYRVAGQLSRDGATYTFTGFKGTVGASDLAGTLSVDAGRKRPFLSADLVSRVLDFDDMGPIFGVRPSAGKRRATAAPTTATSTIQAENAPATASAALVLPDAPLQVERVRQMDARVHYIANTIRSQDFPLRGASLNLALQDGVLTLDPFTFAFQHGKIAGKATIDARADIPVSDIDVAFTGIKLEQFFAPTKEGAPLEGSVEARAVLHAVGNSIHKAASTANGRVAVVIPQGHVRKAFAELMGINVASGVGLMILGDHSQADIRCGIADFRATNGKLNVQNMILDTSVVQAEGKGTADLKTERLHFQLIGHPKDPELLRLRAPITVSGSLSKPDIGVDLGDSAVQGGLALGLGALLTPLAAILPFIDFGTTDDADCKSLINEARAHGAPVKKS